MIGILTRFISLVGICLGLTFALAYILQRLHDGVRFAGLIHIRGNKYWYFVSPGVACHETGHAVGCWLTGNRVIEFAPFRIKGDLLGYVKHSVGHGWWGAVSQLIISTGPIWFGVLVSCFLTKWLAGDVVPIRFEDYFPDAAMPNLFSYVLGCARAAVDMAFGLLGSLIFSGWKMIV